MPYMRYAHPPCPDASCIAHGSSPDHSPWCRTHKHGFMDGSMSSKSRKARVVCESYERQDGVHISGVREPKSPDLMRDEGLCAHNSDDRSRIP